MGNEYIFFLLVVTVDIVASLTGKVFFISGLRFKLNFSRIALLRIHLQSDSKTDLTTIALSLDFFVAIYIVSSSSYSLGLKSARHSQLCFPFGDMQFFRFFRELVRVVFWSAFYLCPYVSARGFSNIDWSALSVQNRFTSFVFASSSIFFASSDQLTFNHFWNSINPVSSFFSMLTPFWCSTPITAVVFFECFVWNQKLYVLVGGPAGARNVVLDSEV